MRRPLLLAAMLGWLVLAGAAPRKGQEFPDFTAKDALSGQEFSLRDLRGKVVLIDFWATWCGPCVRELPSVKRIYSRFKDQGLEIVSISLDSDPKRFESFVRQKGMTWRHVMEGGGWGTRLAQQYGVNSIPLMIVVDAKGVVVADGLRGRRLEEVIESRLGAVKRPAKGGAGGQPAPSAASEALRQDLAALREQLADVALPLTDVDEQLRQLLEQVAAMEAGSPESGPALVQQVGELHDGLCGVRETLFMLGLVDEHHQVAVPSDPPGTLAPDDPMARNRVNAMLDSAGRSIQSMRALADAAAQRRTDLERKIADLETELSGHGGATAAVKSRAEKLSAEAESLAEQSGADWTDRIEAMGRMIATRGKALAEAAAALADLDPGLRSLARTADALPSGSSVLALRDAFDGIRRKLGEAAHLAGAEGSLALPSDPFEGRSPKDPAARSQLKAQIRVASEAAVALREMIAAQRSRHGAVAAEAEALRREVAGRTRSGEAVDDLEQKFSEILQQALRLSDPA